MIRIECLDSLAQIDPAQWDALLQDKHPLLSHAFLHGMEVHACIGEQTGWLPRYLVGFDGAEMVAAMPLFEKSNSWGEFVFDHAWADAYARYGQAYYPKLVSAIPFSPVMGQKLLVRAGRESELYPLLLQAALELARDGAYSSLHFLFPLPAEQRFLLAQGMIARHDCQYHWYNAGYTDFDHFLAALKRRKRKNIRQERRRVEDAGIRFRRLNGLTASHEDWARFTEFYRLIYARKWGAPVFNQAFFEQMARLLGERMLLVLADDDQECVAGALMYRGDRVLYGRHWGCLRHYDALHFETCYYQGIEYCIEQGVEIFEPGAQGPHKLARGFEPTPTCSLHWLADQRFVPAVQQFCEDETNAVMQHIEMERERSAYLEPPSHPGTP